MALLRIFRLSRKLFIIIGGVALLMGCSGAFALYIGRDTLLGPSATSVSGMKCTDINLVTIRKNDHVWLRKYITADATDGLTRVKTALRVAKAVYDAQKPDLVQVVVLDKNAPTLQSDIRGRALGASVVYVPHPDKIPDGSVTEPITARYYNGGATSQGLFYGERVDMTQQDIDTVMASLKDHSDCADPVSTEAPKPPEGGKHPKKKPAEEATAKAESEKPATHESETPPADHPATPPEVKPEGGATGSFTGAGTETPEVSSSQLSVTATPVEAAHPVADVVRERAQTDPQTTGANH